MIGVVQIIPVGHTAITLLDSIRLTIKGSVIDSSKEYPLSKVVFVLGNKENEESEKKARGVAKEVEKKLCALLGIPCDSIKVDLDDTLSAANDIAQRIREEKRTGNRVVLNLSGSLRTVDIAGYIAASATDSEVIIGLPAYKNDKLVGIREVRNIPLIPIEKISNEKLSILGLLDTTEWKSLDILAKVLSKNSEAEVESLKSKISFHLNYLRERQFVETKKEKKVLLIKLSKLGNVYYEALKE
jgi:hypothetical protein